MAATVLRSACEEDAVSRSTCENPQFPSWTWRYNRNQHLSRYDPWHIRDERMPPYYRNMGVPTNFRFHPIAPHEKPKPFQSLGVNFCQEANNNRRAGFGNSAIGRLPGPAPPRLIVYNTAPPYQHDDLYPVNQIHNVTGGMSLLGPTPLSSTADERGTLPINPSHYLNQTLGQPLLIPGSFPHFNKALPITASRPPLSCKEPHADEPRNLMDIWRHNFARQQAAHARDDERRHCQRKSLPAYV